MDPKDQLREDMKGAAKALKTKETELGSRIAKGKFLMAGEQDPQKLQAMQGWGEVLVRYRHLYETARLILEQSGILVWDKEDVGFMYVTKVDERMLNLVRQVEDRGGIVVNFTSVDASGPVAEALEEDLLL